MRNPTIKKMNVPAALRQMWKVQWCAEQAGIADKTFLSYGTLLGITRNGYLLPWDSDVDFSILADQITAEQELDFYKFLNMKRVFPGEKDPVWLFEYRRSMQYRKDTGRPVHISLKSERNGTKCCIWYQYAWNGFYWHSKSGNWLGKIGLRLGLIQSKAQAEAIAKGIPEHLFAEMIPIDFEGYRYNIPLWYGTCLDYWYPGWAIPKAKGASKCEYLCIIPKWSDPKHWKMVVY